MWNRTDDEQFNQMIEENFDLFARRCRKLGSWEKVAREFLARVDKGISEQDAAKLAAGTEALILQFVEKLEAVAIERKNGGRANFRN